MPRYFIHKASIVGLQGSCVVGFVVETGNSTKPHRNKSIGDDWVIMLR